MLSIFKLLGYLVVMLLSTNCTVDNHVFLHLFFAGLLTIRPRANGALSVLLGGGNIKVPLAPSRNCLAGLTLCPPFVRVFEQFAVFRELASED